MVSQASAGLWLHFFKVDVIQIPLYYTTLQAGGNTSEVCKAKPLIFCRLSFLYFISFYISYIILYFSSYINYLTLHISPKHAQPILKNIYNIIFHIIPKTAFRRPRQIYIAVCQQFKISIVFAVYRHRARTDHVAAFYWKLHILAVNICVNAYAVVFTNRKCICLIRACLLYTYPSPRDCS